MFTHNNSKSENAFLHPPPPAFRHHLCFELNACPHHINLYRRQRESAASGRSTMLRRCIVQRYWFYDLHAKELTENYHLRKPDISESYTRQSQALDRVTKDTPPAELSPFEHALKQAVTPISDTLPVPRHADPCYLSVNGESIPQSWKFLPNNQMYEHLENCHLRWKLHPFQSLISEHPSGYMEPLGPVKGNEDLPYAVLRTHMGKLPLVMRFRVKYVDSSPFFRGGRGEFSRLHSPQPRMPQLHLTHPRTATASPLFRS